MLKYTRQAVILLALSAALASAAAVSIPNNLYGHLDQNTTNFCLNDTGASFGCGPVATVNSFLMLDNKYGTNLIPDIGAPGIDDTDLAAVGATLAGAGYMGCQACNGGTSVADLITGKTTYLNENAPGRYVVHSSASPTFQWFFNELSMGQDIEVLIGFYNGNTRLGGHYLTVNGVSGTETGGNPNYLDATEASLFFIDPSGGANGSSGMYEFLSYSLGLNYGVGGTIGGQNVTTTVIEYGVAESPVPEPGTITALAGLVLLGLKRFRKS